MSLQSNQNDPFELFPTPQPLQSSRLPTPKPWPGATPASTATLKEILQDNHKQWHCFYSDKGFHNHASHTTLALWFLGADPDIMKAAYAHQCRYLRPAFTSPGPVMQENWMDHLGDENYYNAYLSFFAMELATKGSSKVLEEYVFALEVNFPKGTGKTVEMLNRFLASLVHPMIHVGYGFEFNLPGMLVEGVAQTATHSPEVRGFIPASWFQSGNVPKSSDYTPRVLNVLARVLADDEISGRFEPNPFIIFQGAFDSFGDKILKHVNSWTPDLSTAEGLARNLEDIIYLVTLMYAVPGITTEEEGFFNADFFTMHFVTSSMFLSSILTHLKPESQDLLLRAYLAICLTWFVGRGKPQLDIPAFFGDDATLKPLLPKSTDEEQGPSLPLPETTRTAPNPWSEIVHKALIHPDEHVSKLQRTLAHYAQVYGQCEAGYFKDTELRHENKIDGTLFVRAANLTAFRLNQKRADGISLHWDRHGYFPVSKEQKD